MASHFINPVNIMPGFPSSPCWIFIRCLPAKLVHLKHFFDMTLSVRYPTLKNALKEPTPMADKILQLTEDGDEKTDTLWKLPHYLNLLRCQFSSCLIHKPGISTAIFLQPDQRIPFSKKLYNGGAGIAPTPQSELITRASRNNLRQPATSPQINLSLTAVKSKKVEGKSEENIRP